MSPDISEIKTIVGKLHKEKYPDAKVIFLAGSLMRGEGTSTSDLDIVVVYKNLANAYRDSYSYDGWPVEAFVHDPETLKYFFDEVDAPTGYPSLASMVSEGVEISITSQFSIGLKEMASKALQSGPVAWTSKDVENARYHISDLIEDIKAPRDVHELHATVSVLYSVISNFYFRSKGLWSAKGKAIPRRLQRVDAQFSARFLSAFESAYTKENSDDLVSLASEVLIDHGGFLFDGYRLEAPSGWRKG